MTKETMIRNYRKFSAADAYIIGFVYKHELYTIAVDEIAPRFIKVERASSKNGGGLKIQFRLNNQHKQCLIKKGAEKVGDENLVYNSEYKNKGVAFEALVSEKNNIPYRGKDSVPFYIDGDLTINGVSYQIKFEGAQIVEERTLKKLNSMKKQNCQTTSKVA